MSTKTERSFTLSGTVLSNATGMPVSGLRVEVWDKGRRWTTPVECATTDRRGKFDITITDAYKTRLFPDGAAQLYVMLFDQERLVASTLETNVWSAEAPKTSILVRVDREPISGAEPAPFIVRGRVEDATTGPAEGLIVRALDRNPAPGRDVFRDEVLGEALTNEDGWYEIQYPSSRLGRAGKMKADLVIEVFSRDEPPALLVASEVAYRAEPIAEVSLVVRGAGYAGPPEVEALTKALRGPLGDGAVRLVDANEAQLAYLSKSAGVDEANLRDLHAATTIAQAKSLPADALYGLARMGLPADLRLLVPHGKTTLRRAVEQAASRNIIAPRSPADIDALADTLRDAVVDSALSDTAIETGALGAVLATSLSPAATQRAFLACYLDFDGPIHAFYQHLASQPGFESPATVEDFKLTLRIALLLHNNLPLMNRVRALRVAGQVQSLADLAALPASSWQSMLADAADPRHHVRPIPPHFQGDNEDARAAAYVAAITGTLSKLHPTTILQSRVGQAPAIDTALVRAIRAQNPDLDPREPLPRDAQGITDWPAARAAWEALRAEIRSFPGFDHDAAIASQGTFDNPVRAGVSAFLQAAPGFEIGGASVAAYLAAHPTAINAVPASERAAVVSHLEATQRVFRVTPRAEHTAALLAAGLDSARRIARMPKAVFVQQFAGLLGGEQEAKTAYAAALHQAGAAQVVHTAMHQASTDILPYAIRASNGSPTATDAPNLTSLFGAQSLCECAHCRSVLSPAAYLVDLLHTLDPDGWNVIDEDGHPVKKPADVLFSRRPDLAHIKLTCENTNTPIPYIDLVNEILETYLQARFVDHNLKAAGVARDVGKATRAELRAVPQYVVEGAYTELRDTVYPNNLPFDRALEVERAYLAHLGTSRFEVLKTCGAGEIVAEDLLLSVAEYGIITGASARPVHEHYGYTGSVAAAVADLAHVPTMLARAGVTHAELIALLDTWFINRDQSDPARRVTLQSSTTPCDLANTTIAHLDAGVLDRLHRFSRLQRKLGWPVADLDRVLLALGADDLDVDALRKIALVSRLSGELKRSPVELAALWAPLDTWGDDALYLRLFQNHAVATEADLAALALRYPFSEGTPAAPAPGIKSALDLPEIEAAGLTIGDHVPAILAALGVTERDLEALLESANLDAGSPLVVDALSALYRRSLLAKALGLRAEEIGTLLQLVGPTADPFTPREPEGTAAFVRVARLVKQSGFSVRLLDYIYRDHAAPGASPAPTTDRVMASLDALRKQLLDAAATGETARGIITEHVSQELDHPATLTRAILETMLGPVIVQGGKAMDDLLTLADARRAVDTALLAETYRALHKVALLIRGLGLTEREIVHIMANRDGFGSFDVDHVRTPDDPIRAFAGWQRVAAFVALRERLPKLEKTLIDVFEVASGEAAQDEVRAALAQATGWEEALVAQIARGLDLDETAYRDERRLVDIEACLALSRRVGVSPDKLFDWSKGRLNAAEARDVVQAVKARYDDDAWLDVAQKLNDGLRDRQRNALVAYLLPRMRAEGIESEEDLFQRFLIDVDMCPCMETSRIKQAISSVQLFVQRALLGKEPEVSPAHIDAEQWKWRKSYRVWEANRKVFLYPENWIEPELRDGKSPFFQELETDLMQGELTDESAEEALTRYVEKLDETSFLEPCGMYWQEELGEEPIDVLHVFARTQTEPCHYYYRRFVDRRSWTPWERVELDIQGFHLIPVVHNRRLHIFWPVFTTVPDVKQQEGDGKTAMPPATRLEIRLVWSEYRQGKWQPKRTSAATLVSPSYSNAVAQYTPFPADHAFRATVEDGRLSIRVRRQLSESGKRDCIGGFWSDDCTRGISVSHEEVPAEVFPQLSQAVLFAQWLSAPEVPNGGYTVAFYADKASDTKSSILASVPYRYRLLYPSQIENPIQPSSFGPTFYPCFFQDPRRTYFIRPVLDVFTSKPDPMFGMDQPEPAALVIGGGAVAPKPAPDGAFSTYQPSSPKLVSSVLLFGGEGKGSLDGVYTQASTVLTMERVEISAFCHLHAPNFVNAIRRGGVKGLLTLENQRRTEDVSVPGEHFLSSYQPTFAVRAPYPADGVSFDADGAYSLYNWELFFHVPMLIASQLSANQRYEEAQRWLHYIFDPTTHSDEPLPKRFWKTLPLHDNQDYAAAQDLMSLLSYAGTDAATLDRKQKVEQQVAEWVEHPFDPHRIARLRVVAYQKSVVMKYVDNLIAWGDQLFSRDTLESINEATQLYVLAASILGPRPVRAATKEEVGPITYAHMRGKLDDFSDVAVKLENMTLSISKQISIGAHGGVEPLLSAGNALYFCTPQNDKLLGYWDTVADRLFKIRNCMNIEGVTRSLALFEPPIDPALLVRATAAGVDLQSVLADITAPLPHYRFNVMLQKALELCGELKSMGGALLSAIEKKDGEALAALRATHESSMLKAVKRVRQKQIREAEEALAGLEKTRAVTEERHRHYANIAFIIPEEVEQVRRIKKAQTFQEIANLTEIGVSLASMLPNVTVGISGMTGSPVSTVTLGSTNTIAAIQSASKILMWKAGYESYKGNLSSICGGWLRRSDDWKLQARLAKKELAQIDKQIAAARIRIEIARAELANNELQTEQAASIEEYLREKYTNQELYGWMITQASALYFQTYKLAYDMAKRAERAFHFERGTESPSYIQFGHWDSLKKGLFAGERLALDLKRLDAAYLGENAREYEITKQISLALHDPASLRKLKDTGTCEVELPEELYDADYPGHYFRRIKSVSLTLPCVTGPYTSINCTLTQTASTLRVEGTLGADYADAKHFRADYMPVKGIATSHGQNDAGLFEVSFRDERYLPFEGAGAIGRFRIDLPKETNAFDFETLSDVVLKVSYTAREGGSGLREAALDALNAARGGTMTPKLQRLISVRDEHALAWTQFRAPAAGATPALELTLDADTFSFLFRGKTIEVTDVDVHVVASSVVNIAVKAPGGAPFTDGQPVSALGTWRFEAQNPLPADATDMFVALTYTVS